jgi:predicted TPR repeat methyltransferase
MQLLATMRDKFDWAGKPSTDSAEVMRQYDEMAPTYDETLLREWGYQTPATAAELLARYTELQSIVLDAGCGTGITGAELARVGFNTIHGADISKPSLENAARKGIYQSLVLANLLEPLPFPDDTFDASICIGVLSYIPGNVLFREMCRVVRSGGIILFSHRTDLIAERSFDGLVAELEAEGLWSSVFRSANLPYLPGHPDFGTRIEIQLFVLRVGRA